MRDFSIPVAHDDRTIDVPATIEIRTVHPQIDPSTSDIAERSPTLHQFALVLDLQAYEEVGGLDDFEDDDELDDFLIWVQALYKRTARGFTPEAGPIIALAEILQVSPGVHIAEGYGWADSLDHHDDEGEFFGQYMDEVVNDGLDEDFYQGYFPRFGVGNLFMASYLAVDPSHRGSELGLKLLCRALRYLGRGQHDIAVMIARPTVNVLIDGDSTKPSKDAAACQRLAAYYQRAGFQVLDRHFDEVAPMLGVPLNTYELPARYWDINSWE